MKLLSILSTTIVLFCCSNTPDRSTTQQRCEWCGANEAPANANAYTTIAGENEEGQRIRISGTVYKPDGQSPAGDVILYLYHTNAKGIYPKKGDEQGNAKRHGYLRGWIKTADDGTYAFETIKPAAYPGRTEPAHIHLTVKEPNKAEYWLKSYLFKGDELLTAKDRESDVSDKRFYHIIDLKPQEGLLRGQRDILLKD